VRRNLSITAGQVYNVGGGAGNAVSLLDLIEKIEQIAAHRLEYQLEARRPGDQLVYLTDYSKLYQHSGWKPEIDLPTTLEMLRQFWEESEAAQKSRQTSAVGETLAWAQLSGKAV
jgi:CDP-paratose 2-epimerase